MESRGYWNGGGIRVGYGSKLTIQINQMTLNIENCKFKKKKRKY